MSAPALAQTPHTLAWDESDTSTVSGYAVAIDGTRTDYGLTPAGSEGACGCSVALSLSGGSHTIVVSAYNSGGETAAPTLVVGPRANPGGPYSGQVGVDVPVSGASSTDTSAGTLTSYQWQWGDGSSTSSSSTSASHVFSAAGTYTVTLTVVDNAGATDSATTSATISAPAPPPPTLPSPWQQTDVGTTGQSGAASYASGTFTVSGGGADVSGPSDSFSYVYQSLTGDGRIIARVIGLSNTNEKAKAGIMLRETLAPDSPHVMLDLEPTGGIELIARSTSGGDGTVVATTTSAPPVWVELTRTAGGFSAAISADGTTWSQIGSASISMASTLDVGLIVCSHDTTVSNTGTFDNVTVEQGTFTVPPAAPSGPSPSDGSTGVATSPTLTWAAAGANAYDVKFGATNPPPQVSSGQLASNFSTGSLALSTKYYWQVAAHSGAGVTVGPVWSFTTAGTEGGGLPAPWATEDIGATGAAGSASYSSGTFTVAGAGADIGGTDDAFRYVDQALNGDLEIVTRVVSFQNANASAKAGLMMRGSAASGAADVVLDAMPDGSVEFATRPSDGAATTTLASASQSLPAWLKLSSAAGTITGYVSRDGSAWTQVGSTTISLPSDALVGLAVTSHDATQTATAVFDSVSVTAAMAQASVASASDDVVIYASDAGRSSIHGSWRAASSSSSPNEIMLTTPDRGAVNANAPLAAPTNYVDFTFTANAGTSYRIWMRLRARKDNTFNDSLWLQFSDARATGSPIYAMNSTSGLLENLATDSSRHGLSGWGWVNGAYWLSQATTVTFATSGLHTVRVQVREDGVEFDQIVLSPSTYLNAAPGPSADDSTTVPR